MHQHFGRYQQQQSDFHPCAGETLKQRIQRRGTVEFNGFFNFIQTGDHLMAVTVVNISASKDIYHTDFID